MSFKKKRQQMTDLIEDVYNLDSPRVIKAMDQIPRHKFLPLSKWDQAYADGPIHIGYGQTISQPYTVARMTDLLINRYKYQPEKVLEIGTGSGYQAAVLSKFFKRVYTVEIIPELASRAKKRLKKLGFDNVLVKSGSGQAGWKKYSPFDGIIITAGVQKQVPEELIRQLKVGGVLVAPVGRGFYKKMMRLSKLKEGKFKKEKFQKFSFVPFVEK